MARRAPARRLLFGVCLALLTVLARSEPSIESLRDLRTKNHRQHGFTTPPDNVTEPLGRKNLPHVIGLVPPRNHTLPHPLKDLSFVNSTLANNKGRRLLESQNSSGTTCRFKRNTILHGGQLPNGPRKIKDVATAAACCARCSFIDGCEAWVWNRRTKVCLPRGAEGWKIVSSDHHVSGFPKQPAAVPSPPPSRPIVPSGPSNGGSTSGRLIWKGKLTPGDNQLLRGFAGEIKTVKEANNKMVIRDPTGMSNDTVIKTMYNAGCWSPASNCGGGALFYAWPKNKESSIGDAARLEYDVYFPSNFPWIKGGKLPGFLGGDMGCSGGADAAKRKCWSVRLMWRRDGEGEAYVYADNGAQDPGICNTPGTVCDGDAGTSLMRGAFTFKRGRWNHIALTVRMNDVGKKNGLLQIDVDGDTKILYEKMVYRTAAKPDLNIDALMFATWYGGSDDSWAPESRQETYWKNFKIYKLDD